jgi:hypothetical protein
MFSTEYIAVTGSATILLGVKGWGGGSHLAAAFYNNNNWRFVPLLSSTPGTNALFRMIKKRNKQEVY